MAGDRRGRRLQGEHPGEAPHPLPVRRLRRLPPRAQRGAAGPQDGGGVPRHRSRPGLHGCGDVARPGQRAPLPGPCRSRDHRELWRAGAPGGGDRPLWRDRLLGERRVKEIGIRRALGAETRQVIGMVMGQGMLLVAIGGAIGLVLAAMASRALSAVLFVGPFDPASFGAAFAVLAAVAAIANGVPAWRASRVDATEALRAD
ncbi:MAG: FtsX-like permease family protein [Gemmatimonadetes bacterium]|nr:FtsX-like permease family protein [Gemmatimonadota bacterium]